MRIAVFLTLVLILSSPLAAAAQGVGTSEVAAIRAEIAALTARLDRLEREAAARPTAPPAGAAASAVAAAPPAAASPPRAPAPATAASTAAPAQVLATAASNGLEALELSGDLRYRHETVNDDAFAGRERQRIRARFGVTAHVTDDLEVGLTVATGGDDPISANQTLGGGFDRKPLGVDRAFFAWQATEDLAITGGKIANPFFRPGDHHLIYDTDLNMEGLALRYDRTRWFASFAGLWVEERADENDSILLGGQVGYRLELAGGKRLTAGVSYYDYLETEGRRAFWDGESAGNRLDASGRYASDFNEAELFASLELEAAGRPLTVFADYVRNVEADGEDAGYALGASYGEVTKPGTWRVGYAYQELEADAVIGTFTDSDWAGGGTDGRGHVVDFNYGFRPRWTLGLRYFLNERGMAAGEQRDYNRLQADVSFSY